MVNVKLVVNLMDSLINKKVNVLSEVAGDSIKCELLRESLDDLVEVRFLDSWCRRLLCSQFRRM